MKSLEVRIPISPKPHFVNAVKLIAKSVRALYPGTTTRVSVGSGNYDCLDFSQGYINICCVDEQDEKPWAGTAHPYIAQMMERFKPPFHTEYVLMLDADVIPIRRFDELFTNKLMAMQAHVSPVSTAEWHVLHIDYNVELHGFDFEYTGWDIMISNPYRRLGPPYFNTGVVMAPAALLEKLYGAYMDALTFVRSQMDSYFFEQIALTLALAKTGLPFEHIPLRYNFPNQPEFNQVHPVELADVRLLHFLRTDIVDREKDFVDANAIHHLVNRTDLTGSNEVLRRRVQELL